MTGRQGAPGGSERATRRDMTEAGSEAAPAPDPLTTTRVTEDTEPPELNFERLRGAYDQAREEEAVMYWAMRQAVPRLNLASEDRPVLSEEQTALVQAHERAGAKRRELAARLLQPRRDGQRHPQRECP